VFFAVAEQTPEAKIRDLQRRLDLDPGSRLFVSLAEEYRKLNRLKDALSALQKGLLAHPGYVAAQVSLGRVYIEAGQVTDAIATFTKVLVADPGNLVAAKSLADIQLARGDKLEALKKYKLYRALSGDRKVDPMIAELEPQVAPRPIVPPRVQAPAAAPPPPKFQETDKGRRRAVPKSVLPSVPLDEPFEVTSLTFEIGEDSGKGRDSEDPFLVPTRDGVIIAPSPRPSADATPRPAEAAQESVAEAAPRPPFSAQFAPPPVFSHGDAEPGATVPLAQAAAGAEPEGKPEPEPEPEPELEPERQPAPTGPTGRALADLYYAQGHYAEALQIYDDLVSRHPFDEDLKRLRRDSEARLLPAGSTPGSTAPDPVLDRRMARIRALRSWLGQVQAG
jgi:tetratricopeptide (TPR) repeat protein